MRLVTRGDLDGLTCAVLITSVEEIGEIRLIHPQDITDDKVEITDQDILANVPYHPACAKWFDHHLQTGNNPEPPEHFDGAYGQAPSAARLVWNYYGGEERLAKYAELVKETDRLDSARLTPRDVTDPQRYILLGYTIDSRTGAGRAFQGYFHLLLQLLKTTPIEEILQHPRVAERVEAMRANDRAFRQALQQYSRQEDNVVITDFREAGAVPPGNRFLIYTLFPQANVSVRIHWGPGRESVIAAVGHSIFNRTCQTSVGDLMARYGGGGHHGAGTVPLPPGTADEQIAEIIAELRANG